MKLLLLLTLLSTAFSQRYSFNHEDDDCRYCEKFDSFSVDSHEIENGEMVIYKRGRAIVEIDKDGELIVKGENINTTRKQRKMLRKYVIHYENIVKQSIQVGIDGAKIGVTAATEVVKAIFTLDIDEMERRIEKMERKLERKSERLEEKAEDLEFHAEEFVAIRCLLKRQIEELENIDEF